MAEGAEMQFTDDPKDLCRVYQFRVRVSRKRLLNKYVAFWYIVRCMWGVLRRGR